jgi:gliding motility-associated-like protein
VGIYSVSILSINSCSVAQSFTITEPSDIALTSASVVAASCQQNATGVINLTLTGGTPNYQAIWSNGFTGLSNSNFPAGVYTATITDQNNCEKQFTLTVDTLGFNNSLCVDLFVPEIISPNGDGKNDFFVITKIEAFPNNTLNIFNRWGSLVYQKKGYKNEFDGKANVSDALGNGLLPSGTYFIVLDFGDDISKPYHGYIELQY